MWVFRALTILLIALALATSCTTIILADDVFQDDWFIDLNKSLGGILAGFSAIYLVLFAYLWAKGDLAV